MEGLCSTVLGMCALSRGELEPAREALETAIPSLDAVGERRRAAIARAKLVRVRAELGDFPLAARLARAAAEGFRAIEDHEDVALLESFEGLLRSLSGEPDAGRAQIERVLEGANGLSEISCGLIALDRALVSLASVRAARSSGEQDEGRRKLAEALERIRAAEQPLRDMPGSPVRREDAAVAVRFADALVAAHQQDADHALRLPPHGQRFEVPSGSVSDCTTRPAMRRILARLAFAARARPGQAQSDRALFAAGWPSEHPGEETARMQLYAVLGSLRKLGLGEYLRATDQGHVLDPQLPIVLVA
jgi:hypothetical protein